MRTVWMDPKTGTIGIFKKWKSPESPLVMKIFNDDRPTIGRLELEFKSGAIYALPKTWVYLGRF